MRVAHIITRLILGGAQENTLHSVDDQHHQFSDQVCLITGPGLGPEGSLIPQAKSRGLDVRVLPELHRALNPRRDWRAYRAIFAQLKQYRPEIVHTHSSKAGIIGRLAAYRLNIPAVHTIHGASFHFGQPAALHWAYKQAEKTAAGWCQHFISVCDSMSDQYIRAGVAPADRFTTIYSGMNVEQYIRPAVTPQSIRTQLGISDEDIVVGKIARLFHLKGHEYLIESAQSVVRAVPNLKFLFIGDGILRQEFQQRINQLGLTNHFIFAGLIAPEQVGNYIHAMDIVAHTSVWEGLARVLPQASLAAKPTISFSIDGAPEVCIHEKTGLLVAPREVPKLADAIIRLATDASLRERLGKAGQDFCREKFCHRRMTEQIRSVYERVLSGNQQPSTAYLNQLPKQT